MARHACAFTYCGGAVASDDDSNKLYHLAATPHRHHVRRLTLNNTYRVEVLTVAAALASILLYSLIRAAANIRINTNDTACCMGRQWQS